MSFSGRGEFKFVGLKRKHRVGDKKRLDNVEESAKLSALSHPVATSYFGPSASLSASLPSWLPASQPASQPKALDSLVDFRQPSGDTKFNECQISPIIWQQTSQSSSATTMSCQLSSSAALLLVRRSSTATCRPRCFAIVSTCLYVPILEPSKQPWPERHSTSRRQRRSRSQEGQANV